MKNRCCSPSIHGVAEIRDYHTWAPNGYCIRCGQKRPDCEHEWKRTGRSLDDGTYEVKCSLCDKIEVR